MGERDVRDQVGMETLPESASRLEVSSRLLPTEIREL